MGAALCKTARNCRAINNLRETRQQIVGAEARDCAPAGRATNLCSDPGNNLADYFPRSGRIEIEAESSLIVTAVGLVAFWE